MVFQFRDPHVAPPDGVKWTMGRSFLGLPLAVKPRGLRDNHNDGQDEVRRRDWWGGMLFLKDVAVIRVGEAVELTGEPEGRAWFVG